jgi:hypothetical protein
MIPGRAGGSPLTPTHVIPSIAAAVAMPPGPHPTSTMLWMPNRSRRQRKAPVSM